MAQYTWANCPDNIRGQVESFTAAGLVCLGDNFIGAYLHGSLALGGFNPERSDLDLLFMVREHLPAAVQRDLAQLALHWSNRPRPLEFSVVRASAIQPWQYPTPYEFHFSESWRERLQYDLSSGGWATWPEDGSRIDPDLAAHFKVTRQRGVCLAGQPIETVIPEVPRADFVASIMADFNWALECINENPVYAVLNCCRIYHYLLEERVLSKAEGAYWALGYSPEVLHPVVQQAWDVYAGDSQNEVFPADTLAQFVKYIGQQIRIAASDEQKAIEMAFVFSWNTIEQFYSDRIVVRYPYYEALLALIQELRQHGYDQKLRAGQSLATFILSRSRKHGLRREQTRLEISLPDDRGMKVELSERPIGQKIEIKVESVALTPEVVTLIKEA